MSSTVSVEQRRRDRAAVEAQPRADARAAQRVGDEGLAGVAHLGAVALLGEGVGAPDGVPVDVRVVLGDLSDELLEPRVGRLEREPDVREVVRHAPRIPRPAGGPAGRKGGTQLEGGRVPRAGSSTPEAKVYDWVP